MLILAPMQGLTELVFRKTFHLCFPGAFDYAISPFISLTHGNLRNAEKKLDDVLPQLNNDSMPVIPQILGHEKEEFVDLMARLGEMGYDEVNWNLGCPMRRVAGKHRGSGMLPYPNEVRELLEYVCPRISNRLSVKVRLGYRSADEIDEIIPILNDYPLANVTIHPRIGKQMYSGLPNFVKLSEIVPHIRHRLIYNGDVCSVGDYERVCNSFQRVSDVMIGRGALYNPLLPMQIRGSVPECSISGFILSLVHEINEMDISEAAKVRKIKEYWCLLSKALPGSESSKRRVLHSNCLDEIHDLVFEMTK